MALHCVFENFGQLLFQTIET